MAKGEVRPMLHFQIADGYVGDPIPFFWRGEFHLFYLKRPEGSDLLEWGHAVTSDWRSWKELPMALRCGREGEPDASGCWTGSVIESGGVFHIFYTGWNPKSRFPQTICHAVSRDLVSWEKDPHNPILEPDTGLYEGDDWRDPFVFWNAEEKRWWMTITARERGSFVRRGCVALAVSGDLISWEVKPPIWSPHAFHAPECTDLFMRGGKHYLIFSNVETRYRWADGPRGPWHRAAVEDLDGPQLYAAKAFHCGDRDLLVGWIAAREGERDGGKAQWGGALSLPRELVPMPDGSLAVRVYPKALPPLSATLREIRPVTGRWHIDRGSITGACEDGCAVAFLPGVWSDFAMDFSLTIGSPGVTAGLLLRLNGSCDGGYALVFEPGKHRFTVRPWQVWGDVAPIAERPFDFPPGEPFPVKLCMDGSLLEVFVGEKVSLACRTYDHRSGNMAFFTGYGEARWEAVSWAGLGGRIS